MPQLRKRIPVAFMTPPRPPIRPNPATTSTATSFVTVYGAPTSIHSEMVELTKLNFVYPFDSADGAGFDQLVTATTGELEEMSAQVRVLEAGITELDEAMNSVHKIVQHQERRIGDLTSRLQTKENEVAVLKKRELELLEVAQVSEQRAARAGSRVNGLLEEVERYEELHQLLRAKAEMIGMLESRTRELEMLVHEAAERSIWAEARTGALKSAAGRSEQRAFIAESKVAELEVVMKRKQEEVKGLRMDVRELQKIEGTEMKVEEHMRVVEGRAWMVGQLEGRWWN